MKYQSGLSGSSKSKRRPHKSEQGSHLKVRSGAGLVDHLFPDAFGSEDELDELAGGAFAANRFGDVVCGAFYFVGGVSDGYSEPHPPHHHQIRQVVAEKGDLGFVDAGFSQNVFVGGDLVPLFFVDKSDVEFLAAAAKRGAAAAGNHAGVQTGGDGEGQALAVMGVEVLDFERTAIGLREQRDASIRERAIHIHQHDFNAACALLDDGRCTACCSSQEIPPERYLV